MNTLFILAHPEPTSFNAQLVRAGRDLLNARGDQVTVIDLYAEGFDPVERAGQERDLADGTVFAPLAEQSRAFQTGTLPDDMARHFAALKAADLVVFHPAWWHSVPAILKGWFDRVFISGGLYTSTMRYDRGYFRGRRALCLVTSGTPAEAFVPGGRGGTLDQILWSAQFSLYYTEFDVLAPHAPFGVAGHGYSYVPPEQFRDQFAGPASRFLDRPGSADSDRPRSFPRWGYRDALGQPKAHPATTTGDLPC